MYSNVPTKEAINILEPISTQLDVDTAIAAQLTSMANTVMKENYFTF